MLSLKTMSDEHNITRSQPCKCSIPYHSTSNTPIIILSYYHFGMEKNRTNRQRNNRFCFVKPSMSYLLSFTHKSTYWNVNASHCRAIYTTQKKTGLACCNMGGLLGSLKTGGHFQRSSALRNTLEIRFLLQNSKDSMQKQSKCRSGIVNI